MIFSAIVRMVTKRKQDRLPPTGEQMTARQLELAQQLARETLEADHQAIERYAKFAVSFPTGQ
jgi:hypothetical protein